MSSSTDDLRVSRIASLTLVNAMIFQQTLASQYEEIRPLSRIIEQGNSAEAVSQEWKNVLDEIDYIPIFALARNIVQELIGTPGIDDALRYLAETAMRITSRRAALRHDLMGRVYHRLLADRKYFGAFYTTIPAATLLLKLALSSWNHIDWSRTEEIEKLRIADLACGTGTLLKSAIQTVADNHVRTCGEKQISPNLRRLHQILIEKVISGFDVIPFAIHLAASAVSVHEPDVKFDEMNFWTMPLSGSGTQPRLGSLEFLSGKEKPIQADLFGSPTGPGRFTGKGVVKSRVRIQSLDLCVMNPPFTRSVGGNLLFGNLPKRERQRMQRELQEVARKHGVAASITAGLGSVFTALADKLLKPGGQLALVLPRAVLSGVAWKDTRQLLGRSYHIQYIVVSHEPNGWNFSENTKLSECLIVAKSLWGRAKRGDTIFINLWSKPKTSIEALTIAEKIAKCSAAKLENQKGISRLKMGEKDIGEIIASPGTRIWQGLWREEAAFAQTELSRVAYYLSKSKLYLPNQGCVVTLPLTPLAKLGTLGPDARDIHDGFKPSGAPTAYAAFLGHSTESVHSIGQQSNNYLAPLTGPSRGRPLRDPNLLWSRAGQLLVAERLRLNTARLLAIRTDQPVLSNSWWPVAIRKSADISPEDIERIVALWLNSSIGIISFIASRVDTEGAWVKFKKPILQAIGVLNPFALGLKERQMMIDAYENLNKATLLALPDIRKDATRADIDRELLKALNVKCEVGVLRSLLATEPLLSGIALG